MKDLLIGLGLLSTPAIVFVVFGTSGIGSLEEGSPVPVSYDTIDQGVVAFSSACAACHGRLAEGTDRGPDLIAPQYGRSAFRDDQFRRAVRQGLPARRGYDAMPPAPTVSASDLERMIAFVRELQRNKGVR
jgi:mono/diheme cytochrome c family protein